MKTYKTIRLTIAFFLLASFASAQGSSPEQDLVISKAVHRISNKRLQQTAGARAQVVVSSSSSSLAISKKVTLVGNTAAPVKSNGNMGSTRNANRAVSKDVNKIRK